MSKLNPKVDEYLSKTERWNEEMEKLRSIILKFDLNEELKWGKPCYTYKRSNVVIIQGFKNYVALMFFKGVLLEDPDGILTKMGKNTQAGRQIRFSSLKEIGDLENTAKAYILEAIDIEKEGLEVEFKETSEYEIPMEFQTKLEEDPELKNAFENLTPGRQRAYLLYFAGAKQSKTRRSRVDRYIQHILNGKGLNDR